MDSVTQIVLGAAVGEAALGKKVGNKAILWGVIAGTIPDLDIIGRLFLDDITALEWHRGFSHSLMFSLITAPIFGFLIQRFSKNKSGGFKGWTKLMFWGFVTHPLLDCHTTWGTQFFWPFDLRIAYNNIFVVDPLYTIPFMVFLIMAMVKSRENPKRTKLNKIGLIVSSSYMLLTLLLKVYTFGVFKENLVSQKIHYNRISTRPTPFNSILWTANVETRDSFLIGYYSVLDDDKQIDFLRYAKNHELIDSIKNQDQIKRLIKITQDWYLIQNQMDTLVLCDLRFGEMGMNNPTGKFVFKHKLMPVNNEWRVYQINPENKEAVPMMKRLWKRILGDKSTGDLTKLAKESSH